MLNNNKFNTILHFFFLVNDSYFVVYNNFKTLKNEIFLFSNSKLLYNLFFFINNSYLVDIVAYDNLYIKYINFFKKNVYINKFFLYNFDMFVNVISNLNYNYFTNYNNSNWLLRECIEFFGLKFYNINDSRNLLNDYTVNENMLLKNVELSSFSEIKSVLNSSVLFKKNSVIL